MRFHPLGNEIPVDRKRQKGEDASMTLINSNPNRDTIIPISGLVMILALSTFAAIAVFGGEKIETTTMVLTYMTALVLGANALSRGFLETGPGGKFKRSYSFHKL